MTTKHMNPAISISPRLLRHAVLGAALALPAAALVLPASAQAQAQDYPNKPVRIVVGFPPGGIMDIYGRSLANQLQAKLKRYTFTAKYADYQRKGIASFGGDADTKKLWLQVEWLF